MCIFEIQFTNNILYEKCESEILIKNKWLYLNMFHWPIQQYFIEYHATAYFAKLIYKMLPLLIIK